MGTCVRFLVFSGDPCFEYHALYEKKKNCPSLNQRDIAGFYLVGACLNICYQTLAVKQHTHALYPNTYRN